MNVHTDELMGEYEWLKPLAEMGSNVIGQWLGNDAPQGQPQPPVIITQPPAKPEVPWMPIILGGGALLLVGAVVMKKRRRRV